jgi:hypothetical protein
MPAPLLPLLLLAGAAGAVALASSSKKSVEPSGGPPGRTYVLDKNMPPALRDQVLAALAQNRDAGALDAFAAALAPQYPLAAGALRRRAVELRGSQPVPPPEPRPQPAPQPSGNPIVDLLSQVPDPPRSQVMAALLTNNDPASLDAYAAQMDAQGLPAAAQALRMKSAVLRGQQPAPPTPGPVVPPPQPTPGPTPTPPQPIPAVPSPFTLDPGMPPELTKAILGALTTETDPVKLAAFASEIQAQYPIAAGLLMAKASALRLPITPGPQPSPIIPPPVPPFPPRPVPGPPGGLLVGDASTRSGRNAGRPSGYPFIWLHGESTYPAKISKQATGSEMNYPQMSRINPQFAADGTHWINIQTGDALNIPWEWVPKLTGLYRIAVDPGVSPPPPPVLGTSPPSSAIALHLPPTLPPVRKGGPTNGAASHA